MKYLNEIGKSILLVSATFAVIACDKSALEESSDSKTLEMPPQKMYGFAVNTGTETRATFENGVYYWDPDDELAFYVYEEDDTDNHILNQDHIVSHRVLNNQNTDLQVYGRFDGQLTEEEIKLMSPDKTYDYYAYGPSCSDSEDMGFPYVKFTLGNTRNANTTNFACDYVFVRGKEKVTGPAVTYLDGDGQQRFNSAVEFEFEHVFSYMELQLDCNLMSKRITSVEISVVKKGESDDANVDIDTPICGPAKINLVTGEFEFLEKGLNYSRITVNVEGGFDVNDGTIMVTMPSSGYLTGKMLRFKFMTADGAYADQYKIINTDFVAGKKYKAGFKLPFQISFSGVNARKTSLGGNQFSFQGYTFGGNSKYGFETNNIQLNGASSHSSRGMLRMPALTLANTAGRDNIPVKVTIDAAGSGAVMAGNRNLYYAAVSASASSVDDGSNSQSLAYGNGQDYTVANLSQTLVLTNDTPCVGFHGGTTAIYSQRIRSVWIVPDYE